MHPDKELAARLGFLLCACLSVAALALICFFLLSGALPAIREIGLIPFLTGTVWRPSQGLYGILPMILGSLCVTAGALVLGVPVAILTAVYLTRFCPRRLRRPLRWAVDLLAGIPSIVFGFFFLAEVVPRLQRLLAGGGKGILTSSLLLAVMILPTVITVAASALDAVDGSCYESALALGATHERSVFAAVVPAARSGLLAASVLGMGRAVGETMAVTMVAGNQAMIPSGFLSGVRTLTANIVMEMGYAAGLHRQALIATGLVLFCFILAINLAVAALRRRRRP